MAAESSADGRFVSRPHASMTRILAVILILSLTGLLVGVESFSPTQPSATRAARRSTNHLSKCGDHSHGFKKTQSMTCQKEQTHGSSSLILRNSDDDSNGTVGSGVLDWIGLLSQPIVGASLVALATTGHGLPAGPGGAIGAIEGIAYLVVLVFAVLPNDNGSLAKTLSRFSIAAGLLVLASVAAGKGCVPNAKPILDYSAYLPVCGPE